jgi:hypothetical protein
MTATVKPGSAVAKLEATEGGALTVPQRKAFLEVASRTDLDKIPAEQQRGALIAFGQHTGLRPELGEVMIYQGRFYITILGRIRAAHANGLFDGMHAKPASSLDRTGAGYEANDIVWIADVWRKGAAHPFRGWGKVTRAEVDAARAGERTKYTPIAKHPAEMARKRARYDALRLAFPLDEELTEISTRFIAAAEAEMERRRLDAPDELEDVVAAAETCDDTAAPAGERSEEDAALDRQAAQE